MQRAFLGLALMLGFLLSGCATYYNITLDSPSTMTQGRATLLSKAKNSDVKLELGSLVYADSKPLMILLLAKLNTEDSNPPVFGLDSITLSQNPMHFRLLSLNQIRHASMNFKDMLDAFSIPIPPAPRGFNDNFVFSPFFYGGFFWVGSSWDNSYYLEAEYSRRVLLSKYLKATTLSSDLTGGFVCLWSPEMKEGPLQIAVKIKDEIHYFVLHFSKQGKK